ncbi:3-keto-steroid reductase [Macrophomina phaseolina]|uniref:3-keto-steroid reductase n=1 Tax=Macrophomina phaseolina TaxID=35725 RepID=A0ABQ8FZ24_9PEZI|nr:3-keto-steroid reductase [Macrophomina phaseolina]
MDDAFYVLVTGANSGIGFAICCRLIDEFLQTRPQSQTLVLIPTTRSRRKCDDTVKHLEAHLQRASAKAEKSIPGISMVLQKRVRLQPEILDLCSIVSVQQCASRLRSGIPKLDAMIFNAGIGGWTGVNWPWAIYKILTDWVAATTWPVGFKKATIGMVTKPQVGEEASNGTVTGPAAGSAAEPPLGEVFCANVFGHYLLGHYCAPLLSAARPASGRIIWMSSLEAYASEFSLDDFQGLKSDQPYEASKRLTDVLTLTYDSPSTRPWTSRYASADKQAAGELADEKRPRMYLSHPGIVVTGIFPLPFPWLMIYLWMLASYISRWLGSTWHTVRPYSAAVSSVWLALASQETLDEAEGREGKGKWGSSTDRAGHERVIRTEVEGWGWGGILGESTNRKGRKRGALALKEGDREAFEELGRKCWSQMEELREQWEARVGNVV